MTEMVLQRSPEAAALLVGRARLAAVRLALAERERAVAGVRTRLKVFEARYLREVGVLYADLDEWEARIAEREVDLYDSEGARRRATEARQRARETHEAAFLDGGEGEEIDPPAGLKTLFREVARRIHPDFAGDEVERAFRTLLMARANQAYARGDAGALERMLDDALEEEGSVGEEAMRVARQIQHAERDLAALEAEEAALLASELGLLHGDAEAAAGDGRDLVAELAGRLQEQIADARYRFEFTDRQIRAHGR